MRNADAPRGRGSKRMGRTGKGWGGRPGGEGRGRQENEEDPILVSMTTQLFYRSCRQTRLREKERERERERERARLVSYASVAQSRSGQM